MADLVFERLKAVVGAEWIRTDPQTLEKYSKDQSFVRPCSPDIVVYAENVKEGEEILVQVVKEPLGTKGARLTSHVTMPGRFLVFMPTVDHVGVSRKIESRDERSRLRGIVREFREAHGFTGGVIIRTAAAGRPKDLDDLTNLGLMP